MCSARTISSSGDSVHGIPSPGMDTRACAKCIFYHYGRNEIAYHCNEFAIDVMNRYILLEFGTNNNEFMYLCNIIQYVRNECAN